MFFLFIGIMLKFSFDRSMAEAEWAHAANRLIEVCLVSNNHTLILFISYLNYDSSHLRTLILISQVENEPEMIEDWPPVLRSKRRLILTTQLMQQLHCAPPRAVLSADASKNYETVVYFVARLGLGEACSSAYICESDTAVPSESGTT